MPRKQIPATKLLLKRGTLLTLLSLQFLIQTHSSLPPLLLNWNRKTSKQQFRPMRAGNTLQATSGETQTNPTN